MSDSKHWASGAAESMGGSHEKPKKEIKEMRIRKGASGGHVVEHHFHHSEHHAPEEHVTQGDDQLAEHVMSNMGTPNPGEAEADAGQSGAPAGPPPDTSGSGAPTPIPGV